MIALVRHGQCAWNLEGRRHGVLDSPLTAAGERQGRLIGRRLASLSDDDPPLRVVTSPLPRAHRTAELIAEELSFGRTEVKVEVEPRLREIHFGDWQGLTDAEVRERYPDQWRARVASKWYYALPGGESYARAATRVAEWLEEVSGTGLVVAVAHHGIGRAIRAHYLGLDPRTAVGLSQPHHVFYLLAGGSCEPISVHDTGHLHLPCRVGFLSARASSPMNTSRGRERAPNRSR